MRFNNFSKLIGALLALRCALALPTLANGQSLVKRDESTRPWFQVFGQSGKPELEDLVDAYLVVHPTDTSIKIADGMHGWVQILVGFTKCNPNWPLSFFPAQEDHVTVYESGRAWTLPYNSVDGKRHHQFAKLSALGTSQKLVQGFNFTTLEDKAWWQWALLEGVQTYAQDDTKIEFIQTINTLSAIDAVVIEGDNLGDKDNLWNEVYSHAIESPIWVQYGSDDQEYRVIRDLTTRDGSRIINLIDIQPDFDGNGHLFKQEKNLDEVPFRVVHLKDFRKFEGRVGVWDMPSEPL